MIADDSAAIRVVLDRARSSEDPSLLVVAAVLGQDGTALTRAETYARTTRDRLLVALAASWLTGDRDQLDAHARDILADHPDHLLAAWIAGRPHPDTPVVTTKENPPCR